VEFDSSKVKVILPAPGAGGANGKEPNFKPAPGPNFGNAPKPAFKPAPPPNFGAPKPVQ